MGVQELVHKKDLHNQEQHKETPRSGREYSVIGQKQAASLVGEGRRNVMKGNQNVCSQFLHLIIDFVGLIFRFTIFDAPPVVVTSCSMSRQFLSLTHTLYCGTNSNDHR